MTALQRVLSLVTGRFSEFQLQSFADSSGAVFGDRSVLMIGQPSQEPDTGVSLQFLFCTPDIAEENVLISHCFRLRVFSEHSIKLRRVGG